MEQCGQGHSSLANVPRILSDACFVVSTRRPVPQKKRNRLLRNGVVNARLHAPTRNSPGPLALWHVWLTRFNSRRKTATDCEGTEHASAQSSLDYSSIVSRVPHFRYLSTAD